MKQLIVSFAILSALSLGVSVANAVDHDWFCYCDINGNGCVNFTAEGNSCGGSANGTVSAPASEEGLNLATELCTDKCIATYQADDEGEVPTTDTPRTQAKMSFDSNLSMGSRGLDVTRLQQALLKFGFLIGSTDGVFGPITKQAVCSYQMQRKIVTAGDPDCGIFGPKTRDTLNNTLSGKVLGYSTPGSQSLIPPSTSNIEVTHISSEIFKTLDCDEIECSPGEGEQAVASITFRAKALGADVYLPDALVEDQNENDDVYGSGSTYYLREYGNATEPTAVSALVSSAENTPNGFLINQDEEETFNFLVAITATSDGHQSVGVSSIEWALSDLLPGAVGTYDYTKGLFPKWETKKVKLEYIE